MDFSCKNDKGLYVVVVYECSNNLNHHFSLCNLLKSYKSRVHYALQDANRGRVLSMIIDGMDQNHSKIPQVRETTFGSQITQHLTGVLIHGTGRIICQ